MRSFMGRLYQIIHVKRTSKVDIVYRVSTFHVVSMKWIYLHTCRTQSESLYGHQIYLYAYIVWQVTQLYNSKLALHISRDYFTVCL